MALGKAIEFIKKVNSDKNFRFECYSIDSKDTLYKTVGFNEAEFEDAINMSLVKCQSFEDADNIHQIKNWFALL